MSDYIPPELISNILARLPVDDVLRCTSVCKSWYSLIASPYFATLHLNLSSPNQEPRLLISDGYSLRLRRDNQTFDEIGEMDYPHLRVWKLIDCINGLLCFIYDPRGSIMLWNPSLRKSIILPSKPRDLSCVHSLSSYDHRGGFGFVATSNEHKIVRFSYDRETGKRAAEIYQLSSGSSWRDLKLDDCPYVDANSRQIHLNGILYWFSHKRDPTTICAFDLKNEKSSALMVPSCLDVYDYDSSDVVPCTFRDSLCLICWTDKICNVWVMNEYGNRDSWKKLFSIDKTQHGLYGYSVSRTFPTFRHNEELLFDTIYDDENSFDGIELVSYDHNTNKFKNLGVCYSGRDPAFCAFYVESLVLMKAPNNAKFDEKSTKVGAERNKQD